MNVIIGKIGTFINLTTEQKAHVLDRPYPILFALAATRPIGYALPMTSWMLYGAYGFTGKLLINEAVRRGHRPVLVGRNAAKLAEVAAPHDLEWLAVDLTDSGQLTRIVEQFDLVFHAAGPFIRTSQPMIAACLAGHAHYLDITGELAVFESTFRQHDAADAAGVTLMSGVGYDIVPSDCLARYVADKLPGATHLETGLRALADVSSGTVKSGLVNMRDMPAGSVVRREGRLVARPLGRDARNIRFSDGVEKTLVAFPWGDLVTAYHTTGIANITSYLAVPFRTGLPLMSRAASIMLKVPGIQALAERAAGLTFSGPDEAAQHSGRTYLWARVSDDEGNFIEAWLETGEVYRFTALAGIRVVELVLALNPRGALTPAGAFGADFVLDIEGVRRFDALPEH